MTQEQKDYLLDLVRKDTAMLNDPDIKKAQAIQATIATINGKLADGVARRDKLIAAREALQGTIQARLDAETAIEAIIPVD